MAISHLWIGIGLFSISVPVRRLKYFLQSPQRYGMGFRLGTSCTLPTQPQRGQCRSPSGHMRSSSHSQAASSSGKSFINSMKLVVMRSFFLMRILRRRGAGPGCYYPTAD